MSFRILVLFLLGFAYCGEFKCIFDGDFNQRKSGINSKVFVHL